MKSILNPIPRGSPICAKEDFSRYDFGILLSYGKHGGGSMVEMQQVGSPC